MANRQDFQILSPWIKPNSRVLDLGCGRGELLAHFKKTAQIEAYGLEIDLSKVTEAVGLGVNAIQWDLNQELSLFDDQSFDVVIMTSTLQAVKRPDLLLNEMLRIGARGIVTFPNFAHWQCRLHLALKGRMPVSKTLPYAWYNTPNIHLCTFNDFEAFCAQAGFQILDKAMIDEAGKSPPWIEAWPNLLAEVGLYHLAKF
jgi:methionine biosynthesis protein MetW